MSRNASACACARASARRGLRGLALAAALLAVACASDPPAGRESDASPLDARLVDGAYENAFFGLRLPLPDGWAVAPPETEAELLEIGRRTFDQDDPAFEARVASALPRTFQLLTLSRHPVGSPVPFNPMIAIMAEDVAHAPGVATGRDYLFHLGRLLEQSRIPYRPLGQARPFELGGRRFHRQDFEIVPPGIAQSYVFTRDGRYVLGFILTARSPAHMDALFGILSRARFD